MSNKKQIKISQEDLKDIYKDDYVVFEKKIIPNCYCAKCSPPYPSTIVNYKIFINELDDVILKGFCAKCGSQINRYLETGEIEKYQKRIQKIKKSLKKVGFKI